MPAPVTIGDHPLMLTLELIGGLAAGESRWRMEDWRKMLKGLYPRDARAVVLKYLHGLNNVEIAERIDSSKERVRQLLLRAEKILAKHNKNKKFEDYQCQPQSQRRPSTAMSRRALSLEQSAGGLLLTS